VNDDYGHYYYFVYEGQITQPPNFIISQVVTTVNLAHPVVFSDEVSNENYDALLSVEETEVKYFDEVSSLYGSRDSLIGIATAYGRSSSSGRVKNFLFSTSSIPVLRPIKPLIQWVPGALSPGIKRPGRGADHSPPTSAEVKKMWIYISTPPYAFMAL
jgi:hypothetical protein